MTRILVLIVVLSAACATGPRVARTNATAHIDPTERDQAFSRALRVAQERGWLIAVSDRAAGLLTTQSMNTGAKPCGIMTCPSRSTLQITIAETGDVVVNLHRELLAPSPSTLGWFEPTLEKDVRPIEAEQGALLAAILGQAGQAAR